MSGPDVDCEVLVAGAGPAGLAAASLLAREGVRTALAGPFAASGDTRTTALFAGAEVLLERLGVKDRLSHGGAPLKALRIVDRLEGRDPPSRLMFEASEIGLPAFGTNYRNAALVTVLEDQASTLASLVRLPEAVSSYEHDRSGTRARLADGTLVGARLVIAADGRGSPARQAAGIDAEEWDYGQTALAFQLCHCRAHENVSTEIHFPGGPLTVIPLPGNRSAINWLERPDRAAELARLPDEAFLGELEKALGGLLGTLSSVGKRVAFPVRGLSVATLAARRTLLVGEAAHVLPPIGAQGLNLGFRDAAAAAGLVAEACRGGRDPGAAAVLSAYRSARRGDVMSRRTATDLLNRSLLFASPLVRELRGLGLAILAASGPARRALMREGLVRQRDLPALMRRP